MHSEGGADPALIVKDLRGRQNHILARAFDNLDDEEKALLGSIAMANIALPADVLRLLNPKRPIEPKAIGIPERLSKRELYLHSSNPKIDEAYHAWRDAASPEERSKAQATLDLFRERNLADRKAIYDDRLAERASWRQQAAAADAWLMHALPRLEARALLQYDTKNASLDMHPAIRHTVLAGLSQEARNSTGSHVSDALSSRPIKPFKDARTLDDLALAITRVEALNAAGRFENGWTLFTYGGLRDALASLMYAYKALELLQTYFPHGWTGGPVLLPGRAHAEAWFQAAWFLEEQDESELAGQLALENIRMRLEKDENTSVRTLDSLAYYLARIGASARADRVRRLAIRFNEASGNEGYRRRLSGSQVTHYVELGQLDKAEPIIAGLCRELEEGEITSEQEARILTESLHFKFRAGRLSESVVAEHLDRIRALGNRRMEHWSLDIIAQWYQAQCDHAHALDVFSDLIARANETGWAGLPYYEARRARSLAAEGRRDEARRLAAKVDRGRKPPHLPLALLYLELGERDRAYAHALAGYKKAWAEGPPYHDHWDLEDCRMVLAALGEPEPVLPPFDPAKVEPFDFEPLVERLIEQRLAEKAKEAERPDPTVH